MLRGMHATKDTDNLAGIVNAVELCVNGPGTSN